MRERIRNAASLLQRNVELVSDDYQAVLMNVTSSDVVYLDPPYQGVCAARDPRYIEGVAFGEFVQALDTLNRQNVAFILSYDGRTGEKEYGRALPDSLHLERVEIDAGRSSQATLLGRNAKTYESLYLSPALVHRVSERLQASTAPPAQQLTLFETWERRNIQKISSSG